MKRYKTMLSLIVISLNLTGQSTQICNQECRLKNFTSKVPSSFCMPEGFWITQVIDTVDLTDDNRSDLILRWRKKRYSEGDTIRVTIFSMNADSVMIQHSTRDNLYTPIFTDYTRPNKTGNSRLDSSFTKFIYSNYNLVEFDKNTIKVGFFTDATGGMDLHFTYDRGSHDWLLSKKRYWTFENKVIGKQYTSEKMPKEKLSVRQFHIIEFID